MKNLKINQGKIPSTITSKITKYLGISLTEVVQTLYTENYKTLLRKIKDYLNKWRDIPGPWIERLNVIKIAILPKL